MTARRFLAPAAAFLAALALTATGQQPDKKDAPKGDAKDPQSKFEPRSKPGAGQEFLAKFVGEWEVVKLFHRGGAEPTRQLGTCRQEMTHGGRFLRSEFVFKGAGGDTTGTGTIGFEASTGKFTSVWIDSRRTAMSFRQGNDKFDGEQIVLFGKELGGVEGRKSKTVTKLEDGGKRIVHRQFNTGPDGAERVMMELLMTKK